mmetsp:Transcript_51996/g.96235  ORF Transcript_51996/g.96235 Transcript_51996/m.96235 type:complete len:147 (-) Transcript_51996:177-617(-)
MGAVALQCCCDNKRGDMQGVSKEPSSKTPAASFSAGTPPPDAEKLVEPMLAGEGKPQHGKEFTVTVDRTHGGKLGIDCDRYDGATLLIDRVNNGLIDDWNTMSVEYKVCPGDRIVEVNGIRSDARAIVEECRKEKVLHLVCLRPAN